MGFWRRLIAGDPVPQSRYSDISVDELVGAFGGMISGTGLHVSTADALTVPGVAACIQVLTEDLSKVPLELFRKTNSGRREKATEHPAYALLKGHPAPWLSSFAWRRALLHNALAHGNGFSRVWRSERGTLERITLLKHGQTAVRWAADGEPFFDVHTAGKVETGLSWQDVVHIPYRGTTDKTADGIALTGSALNQPVVVLESGDLVIGATLTAGAAYYLSDSGGICPVADVGAGEFVCQLGLAKSTSTLAVDIRAPGVTL